MIKDKNKMQGLNEELESIKTPNFKDFDEDFDEVKEILKDNIESKQLERIESQKRAIKAKYIASWHITKIRLHTYGEQAPQYENQDDKENQAKAEESYKTICTHADKGIEELNKIESWDYDMAMLYLTLQGHKIIGARLHFLDTQEGLQKQYRQAFIELDSIYNTAEDSKKSTTTAREKSKEYSENNKQDSNEDIEIVKEKSKEDSENSSEDSKTKKESKDSTIARKLKPHLTHPHCKAYLEYYRFLYVQRQMEQAAQNKNLQAFKQHLYEAQKLIEKLLAENTHHIYLLTKFKKHRAHIMNLVWHIELKELGNQLEDPFNIELKDNTQGKGAYDILPSSDKLYLHIESMLKPKD